MKNFVKMIVLIVASAITLYMMNQHGLLNIGDVLGAFKQGSRWVLLAIVLQFGLSLGMLFRYKYILHKFGIDVHFPQVAAATFVSNAVGQWAPGSMAVIEVIRVGLMLGADKHLRSKGKVTLANAGGSEPRNISSRLAVASLFDRLVGFFSILAAGAVASALILAFKASQGEASQNGVLASLTLFSTCGALAIGLLPWLARLGMLERGLQSAVAGCAIRRSQAPVFTRWIFGVGERFCLQLQSLRTVVASGSSDISAFFMPTIISLVSLIMACLALYCAGQAIGADISLPAILASFPVIAIASLLPIGFGGMGGYQLVAVAVFGVFGLSAASVSSASLLQNGLLLLQNTVLGMLFAQLSASQIRAILESRRVTAHSLGK